MMFIQRNRGGGYRIELRFHSGGTKLVHDIIEWVGGKQQELKEDAYYM